VLLFALLTGCSQIEDVKDAVNGLTNPLVFEGLVIGVAPPSDDRIDLTGTEFSSGAFAAMELADCADVADLANAPVTGAVVQFLSDETGGVTLHDDGGGSYTADSGDGLVYTAGADATVKAKVGDDESSVRLPLPPIPTVDIPESAAPNQSLGINLTGQAFDNVLVVVIDGATGETTFDNRPDSIEDVYNLTHGSGSLAVEIPGGAFADESVYFVGVAGLTNAASADIENANTVLSAFMGGRLAFSAVSTLPPG
jgi:hypothetical protein